jgi:hypothetical protein
MKNRKRIAGLAIVVALSAGTGVALAEGLADSQGPPSPVQAASGGERLLANGFQNESTFIPITPCRILDTRKGYGKLPAGVRKTIDVRGNEATFVTQGGNPGGCGIPAGAAAIEATVTAIDSGSGFLRAWPANTTQPNATFLNYTSTFNASNTGAITLCGGANAVPCLANQDLNLQAFSTSTHLVIDIGGYFIRQMAAVVAADGTLTDGNRATAAGRVTGQTGRFEVAFDRNVSQCTFVASVSNEPGGAPGYAVVDPRFGNANAVFVATYNKDGVLTDRPFYLQVTC